MRLRVEHRVDGVTLEKVLEAATSKGTVVNTDESSAYNGLPKIGRPRRSVCHAMKEWARDDDGDGIREVHCNTMEGAWTGLRNFLRPFRGVNKTYLTQYAAIYAWGYDVKQATIEFLRALLGVPPRTILRT